MLFRYERIWTVCTREGTSEDFTTASGQRSILINIDQSQVELSKIGNLRDLFTSSASPNTTTLNVQHVQRPTQLTTQHSVLPKDLLDPLNIGRFRFQITSNTVHAEGEYTQGEIALGSSGLQN